MGQAGLTASDDEQSCILHCRKGIETSFKVYVRPLDKPVGHPRTDTLLGSTGRVKVRM
jgi:hypothetical protein